MKRVTDGVEIIGKTIDSGYKHPLYLVRTPDGKFIQLTELLFRTLVILQHETDLTAVAAKISEIEGKDIDSDAIEFLIDKKLIPLGLVTDSHIIFDARKVQARDMLLGLKFRTTLLPEHIVHIVASIFRPLFWPPIMAAVLISSLLLHFWLFRIHGLGSSIQQTLYEPFFFLLVLGLIILSAIFHEIGHAAGCLYGGAKPGKIGVGMYLAWPAFFTNITDVYRVSRFSRLRADIGGVYFNVIFSLFIAIAYYLSHSEPLLLLIIFQDIEILHQVMPFLRLDGYFIVSDIVGIPDLFSHIKPVIISFVPGRKQTVYLKTWVRYVVALWVGITIPALVYFFLMMLINLPHIVTEAWNSSVLQIKNIVTSFTKANYAVTMVQVIQLLLLLLPIIGIFLVLYQLGRKILTSLHHSMKDFLSKVIIGRSTQIAR